MRGILLVESKGAPKIKMGNIYLVGFMGTGKTSAGRELAKREKWNFVDLDELIALREKETISDIFANEGEPYFRRLEKRILKEVSGEKRFVVACGGGIVLDPDNIKIMKETGIIICLTACADVILKRTCGQAHRPLLNVDNPKKQIDLLLKLRAPYYARADKVIDTSLLSIEEVVKRIERMIISIFKTSKSSSRQKKRKYKSKPKR